MYGHRHIDVYKLARSCIDICVWKEETENYDRIIFSLAATECLLLLSLEHLVAVLLCQIQPYPSPLQGSLHFLLYTHLGSHFPVLPPSVLFCHSTLCPTYVALFCYSPPKAFFHVTLLPGNTACPGKQISPSLRIPPRLPGQTHQTRSAAPHLSKLPPHMRGDFRVICVVCSDQRYLMYDLWHLYILPGQFIHFMAPSQ